MTNGGWETATDYSSFKITSLSSVFVLNLKPLTLQPQDKEHWITVQAEVNSIVSK